MHLHYAHNEPRLFTLHRHAVRLSGLVLETTLAPLLVLLAGAVLTSQLRRLTVLARRPYLDTRQTTAADITACVCYAALALSHAAWLVYWAVAPGAPFEVFFEACLLAVWLAAEVFATVFLTLCLATSLSCVLPACAMAGVPRVCAIPVQRLCLLAKNWNFECSSQMLADTAGRTNQFFVFKHLSSAVLCCFPCL